MLSKPVQNRYFDSVATVAALAAVATVTATQI